MIDVKPGDVLLVRIKGRNPLVRLSAWAISLGARMRHEPTEWQHVIVAHHTDAAGTPWGIQGQPGVVGWADLRPWLAMPETISNAAQPKTDEQRAAICAALLPMVGLASYDWVAIMADAASAVTPKVAAMVIEPLWKKLDVWGPGVPGHVICSSLADWAYEQVGLDTPSPDRTCTPADWAAFMQARGWTP
jgi:hypothetical protein